MYGAHACFDKLVSSGLQHIHHQMLPMADRLLLASGICLSVSTDCNYKPHLRLPPVSSIVDTIPACTRSPLELERYRRQLLCPVSLIYLLLSIRFLHLALSGRRLQFTMFAPSSVRSTSSALLLRTTAAAIKSSSPASSTTAIIRTMAAKAGQAEVVLVGCGAPNRGMGWYHAIQMLEGRYVHNYIHFTVSIILLFFCCCNIGR